MCTWFRKAGMYVFIETGNGIEAIHGCIEDAEKSLTIAVVAGATLVVSPNVTVKDTNTLTVQNYGIIIQEVNLM